MSTRMPYSQGVTRLESLGLREETVQAFADFLASAEAGTEAQLGRVVRVDRGEVDPVRIQTWWVSGMLLA